MPKRIANALLWALLGLVACLGIAFIGFLVCVRAYYWNTPIGEVPTWALPFLK